MTAHQLIKRDARGDKDGCRLLRGLAARVAEIARHPCQEKRRDLWRRHNRLERTRPLFLCLPENSWRELIPESAIASRHPLLRTYEWALRHLIHRWEHIHDDFVIEPEVRVPLVYETTGLGLESKKVTLAGQESIMPGRAFAYNDELALLSILGEYGTPFYEDRSSAYRVEPPLQNPDDLQKLSSPKIVVDLEETERNFEMLKEIVGDLLPVRRSGITFINCSLIGTFNGLRGMEQVMLDMFERPQWLHQAMDFMAAAAEQQMREAETHGWLGLNSAGAIMVSSLGYTDELPAAGFDRTQVRLKDQWGLATVQSASGWSPAAQEEFVMQYQRRLLARYGLNIFGCCEPLDGRRIEFVLKTPRLRKVIVSPWSNLDEVAAALQDDYVLAWKPHPAQVAQSFDLEKSQRELSRVLDRTTACVMEVVLKDIHTVAGQPSRLDDYTRMASELVGSVRDRENGG